jgi:hypothetical protein
MNEYTTDDPPDQRCNFYSPAAFDTTCSTATSLADVEKEDDFTTLLMTFL